VRQATKQRKLYEFFDVLSVDGGLTVRRVEFDGRTKNIKLEETSSFFAIAAMVIRQGKKKSFLLERFYGFSTGET
jgi:hypothetical protein